MSDTPTNTASSLDGREGEGQTGEPFGTGSREPGPTVPASGFDPSREAAGTDWAYEKAKDIRLKWMQTAFMQGSDMALPAGHLSDMAEALRYAEATGYTMGYEACHKAKQASQGSGFAAAIPSRGWLPMSDAPTGVPIVARHKPNARMPHGWVATIKLGHGDEEEVGCLDTILHYNGDESFRGFHGVWTGWLPLDALAGEAAQAAETEGLGSRARDGEAGTPEATPKSNSPLPPPPVDQDTGEVRE